MAQIQLSYILNIIFQEFFLKKSEVKPTQKTVLEDDKEIHLRAALPFWAATNISSTYTITGHIINSA